QHLALALRGEAEHRLVPGIGDGVETVAHLAQPGIVFPRQQRRLLATDRGAQAALDAARHAVGGRVRAHPAAPLDPGLDPDMGVVLAHREIAVDRIDLAALIAAHDARRYAGGT